MIPSPIRKALSTIRRHQVAHLLMGGQACVLYGAAEFSRDLDLALLPDPANLDRLEAALAELDAEIIAVPSLSLQHLTEGQCRSLPVQRRPGRGRRERRLLACASMSLVLISRRYPRGQLEHPQT